MTQQNSNLKAELFSNMFQFQGGIYQNALENLTDKLSKMTDAELEVKPAPDQPSTADIVSFFVYHEAYHLGQIGFARKMIGLEALKSN